MQALAAQSRVKLGRTGQGALVLGCAINQNKLRLAKDWLQVVKLNDGLEPINNNHKVDKC